MKAVIELDMSEITANLGHTAGQVNRIIGGVMEQESYRAENWMKTNAPWTDQTSNARNGLACRYRPEGDSGHIMDFFHQVPYGIFLEVRWEGRYAIIVPAVEEFGGRVMSRLEGILTDGG